MDKEQSEKCSHKMEMIQMSVKMKMKQRSMEIFDMT